MTPPLRRLLETIGTEVAYRWTSTRWTLRACRLRATGRHGAFQHPARTPDARALTAAWNRAWPDSQPRGHMLRDHRDRSVRFHSLPGSKRYADSAEEYAEILQRHHTVINEISGNTPVDELIVIATDWGPRDLAAGWTRRRLPSSWPWKKFSDPDDGFTNYFWVASRLSRAQFDAVLTAVADDEGRAIVIDMTTTWLYAPYDGGADALLPTTRARDALQDLHPDWLPPAF